MKEIIVQKKESKYEIYMIVDNKITEFYEYDENNKPTVGNVYVGKIKRVFRNNNKIFVDYGAKKAGLLESSYIPNSYKQGNMLLVRVKREGNSQKGAKLSDKVEEIDFQDTVKSLVFSQVGDIIYDANRLEERIYNKVLSEEIKKIYISDEIFYKKFENYPNLKEQIIYEKNIDFIDKFGLLSEVANIKARKIWLKSGAYIVIEQTEALVSIDVNMAKYTEKKDILAEEQILNVNLEACQEISKQVVLKNLRGIILIDFINMKSNKDKNIIKEKIENLLEYDKDYSKVYNFTKLGLLELSRKAKTL